MSNGNMKRNSQMECVYWISAAHNMHILFALIEFDLDPNIIHYKLYAKFLANNTQFSVCPTPTIELHCICMRRHTVTGNKCLKLNSDSSLRGADWWWWTLPCPTGIDASKTFCKMTIIVPPPLLYASTYTPMERFLCANIAFINHNLYVPFSRTTPKFGLIRMVVRQYTELIIKPLRWVPNVC